MTFNDVVGQEDVKAQLRKLLDEGRVPHALLFCGPAGTGKMATALALASELLGGGRMAEGLVHPDLHFAFPVIKQKGQSTEAVSDQYIKEWREMLLESPYFDRTEWLARMRVENQQAQIGVGESTQILHKLSIKSSQGGYKAVIIWLPELMNREAANRLLKILEEPPAQTVFILVSDAPERLLATILSRTQRIDFPPLTDEEVAGALMARNALGEADARNVARLARGSYTRALQQINVDADRALFFEMFVSLMRLCYLRDVRELHQWSEQAAGWGRERQKHFLQYAQRMVRENFVYNFQEPALRYEDEEEAGFSVRFARFINERNVIGITSELAAAERDIEGNVNARMVFFDFCLKMIVLLIQ
ncbi:MAG: AAA family ATPase [Alloprevotella sp.]|nr:AAA family ATPase [Alloprevotella sp.]